MADDSDAPVSTPASSQPDGTTVSTGNTGTVEPGSTGQEPPTPSTAAAPTLVSAESSSNASSQPAPSATRSDQSALDSSASVPEPAASALLNDRSSRNNSESSLQHQPVLPSRNYPRDPRWLSYSPPPLKPPPSRVLPRFFKVLALVIFLTGTSATLLTVIYQRLVLPKLVLTRARLASLHQHQVSLYDKLLVAIHALVYSDKSIHPKTQRRTAQIHVPDAILPLKAQIDITSAEEETTDLKLLSQSDDEEPLFADESPAEKSQQLRDPMDLRLQGDDGILARTHVSLQRLHASLQKLSASKETEITLPNVTVEADGEDHDESESAALPVQTPMQKTLKSLEDLSTFLSNEAFYASTPAFPAASYGWNYGSASQIPQRSGMDRDKIAQIKNEIRSFKGMLLTRRNFAPPSRQDIPA